MILDIPISPVTRSVNKLRIYWLLDENIIGYRIFKNAICCTRARQRRIWLIACNMLNYLKLLSIAYNRRR